ncbi:MAG: metal ABC transporter permease [Bacillota bacterium]|nr:metal ABC transporter permease [Bacillota bacterium]
MFEIQLILILMSIACSIVGTFLVIRKMAMITDAISHTVLLGIVIAFFFTPEHASPLLMLGAVIMGILTVWFVEFLAGTRLLAEDAAIGIVFPFLFSIAIILITMFAGNVHLDTDSVLLGEVAFAPFDRLIVGGTDIGAKGIYLSGFLLLINLFFVVLFYKELKISTFDSVLAGLMGFSPVLVHYLLITLTSITAVGAFEAVGAILVIGLMVGPPVTAMLYTHSLWKVLVLSSLFGVFASSVGFHIAIWMDASIAGSIAVVIGIFFFISVLISPKMGLLAKMLRVKRQRREFSEFTFMMHLYHHRGSEIEWFENSLSKLNEHLRWTEKRRDRIYNALTKAGYVKLLCDSDDEDLDAAAKHICGNPEEHCPHRQQQSAEHCDIIKLTRTGEEAFANLCIKYGVEKDRLFVNISEEFPDHF